MIRFDRLWDTMKKRGVSTYRLRELCGIDSKTIRRLKANENIETKTINKLCAALDCRVEDILRYTKDAEFYSASFFSLSKTAPWIPSGTETHVETSGCRRGWECRPLRGDEGAFSKLPFCVVAKSAKLRRF